MLYVDDPIEIGNKVSLVQQFKQEKMEVLEMTDLGMMSYFLGMEIQLNGYEVFVFQKKYSKEILKKFKLEEGKGMSTPMNSKEKPNKLNSILLMENYVQQFKLKDRKQITQIKVLIME